MSGPGISVLLPHVLSDRDEEMLSRTAVSLCGVIRDLSDLHVVSTRGIGGTFQARTPEDSRPFGMSRSDLDPEEETAAPALSHHFGVQPCSRVDVYAFCNAAIDHRILGEIALYLALENRGSVVSFGGDLSAHERVGGTLVSIGYETVSATTALASYGDVEFLRRWLLHGDFHLIK